MVLPQQNRRRVITVKSSDFPEVHMVSVDLVRHKACGKAGSILQSIVNSLFETVFLNGKYVGERDGPIWSTPTVVDIMKAVLTQVTFP